MRSRSDAKPGAALKTLRYKRGWTLAEVSRRTGVSASTLSKIENDKLSPTFKNLSRISTGLRIDIAALFAGHYNPETQAGTSGRRSIARADDGEATESNNYSSRYPASDFLNKRIIPTVAELRARSLEDFGELIRHSGEEYAFVLEGEVEFHTTLYAPVRLRAGDSVYFDGEMGHAYVAATEGPCRLLWVRTEPATPVSRCRTQDEPRRG